MGHATFTFFLFREYQKPKPKDTYEPRATAALEALKCNKGQEIVVRSYEGQITVSSASPYEVRIDS